MLGLSTYLSRHFRHASSLGLLAATCTCRQDVGNTGHKLNSQKCVRLVGRCLLPTRTCKLELATLFEEGCLKSLYSTQIIGSTGLTLPHAFRLPIPAPNIRILAVTSTGRQDAGGSCPELSSHKEAGLEASILLAPSDGRENVAAL